MHRFLTWGVSWGTSWGTLYFQGLPLQNRNFTVLNETHFRGLRLVHPEDHGMRDNLVKMAEPGLPAVEGVYGETQASWHP